MHLYFLNRKDPYADFFFRKAINILKMFSMLLLDFFYFLFCKTFFFYLFAFTAVNKMWLGIYGWSD